jgi:uncharacterized protein (TIGR03435 family)
MRFTFALVVAVVSYGPLAQNAQNPATQRFEVASIKPDQSGDGGSRSSNNTGRFSATNMSAFTLILNAYDMREYQVFNAPSWARTERYDVNAVWPGQPGEPRTRFMTMLQNMLADRFGLKAHYERRELPIYELVRARSDGRLGEKLKPSSEAAPGSNAAGGGRITGAGPASFRMQRAELSVLAGQLGSFVGRPVVDRTGLTGQFDLQLTWVPDQVAADPTGPSIFTAIQEQLGLKLEAARGTVDVLVIDSVERPTPD